MKEIEKNLAFNGLRVRTITDAGAVPLVESHPMHPSRKASDEIPPPEDHGGLRAKPVKFSECVRQALTALGGRGSGHHRD